MKRVVNTLRTLAGGALIRLGCRLLGYDLGKIAAQHADEDSADDDGAQPWPPVSVSPKGTAMKYTPSQKPSETPTAPPLSGSLHEQIAQARAMRGDH